MHGLEIPSENERSECGPSDMAFCSTGSLSDEMQLLERMRERDPESAVNVVANGKLLLEFTELGNLRALQCALDHMGEDRVLLFYSTRMFRAACARRRLDILRFMFTHGFDVTQVGVRDILHCVVESVEDEQSAESAQPLVRFLLDAGVDVNCQRETDLFTALHVACRKHLFAIAYLLIIYGADVNAIAMHDEMPLTCAERTRGSESSSASSASSDGVDRDQNRRLVALLESHSARRTWRRAKQQRAQEWRQDAGPSSARKVLSFSGSFSVRPEPVENQPKRQHWDVQVTNTVDSELLGVGSMLSGIMLDTPGS
ncbi:hypothetical protein PybrP1_008580 [[Pythium] brassicae (nom. inval.)]|nr:hypothetical protein PybrP1_008580 [[Pythium] brassicae (nom. inval.)]